MRYFVFNLLVFVFISVTQAQEFNVPESCTFDAESGSYFISNYGDGNIIQINSTGEQSLFHKGLSNSLGMIIRKGVLYVVANHNTVQGFDILDSSHVFEVIIKEAIFLNDITSDDSGNLYVTDSNDKAVYKISISGGTYSLFAKTELDNPNGIVFDRNNNRLVLCYFREETKVDQISLTDSVLSEITKVEYPNLDGIAMDAEGNFYISSWGTGSFRKGFNRIGRIIKYDNQFENSPEIVSDGLYGPADIYYSKEKLEIIVPLFLENDVLFIPQKDFQ